VPADYVVEVARTADDAMSDDLSTTRRRHAQAPRKGDRRRLEILDAAEAALHERPAHELTIEQLADAVGASRSSVYFYFDSKWAVVDALVDRASAEMREGILGLPSEGPFAEFVDGIVAEVVRGWHTHLRVFLAAAERSSHADEATDRWRGIMQQFAQLIARRIEQAQGVEASVDAGPVGGSVLAAEITCWMIERNLYMLFSREHEPAEERAVVDALRAAVQRLLQPGPSEPVRRDAGQPGIP
jgi:AcrR family transcriptional regulator